MKKINWKIIIFAAVALVLASLLAGGICGLIFKNGIVFLTVTLCGFILGGVLIFLSNIDINKFTRRIMDKTIAENAEANGFYNCSTFTTHNAILKIDAEHGKIAYICNLNPTEFQVISAKNITDIKSDYQKAPLGGTAYVYFQFVYEGMRIRIPTFTAIHCVYSLQSAEVLEGISKADAYAELLQRAKAAAQ